MYRIYLIRNLVNGKKYVGITEKTIKERFRTHRADSYKKDNLLYMAMRKYGRDNFSIELLEDNIPFEKGEERERYWISYYDTYKHGYNMTEGGSGVVGYKFSDETRKKMSDSWSYEKIITPERNNKISESMKGRKFSEEHRRKLSEAAKKRVGSKNPFYGKKHSKELLKQIHSKDKQHIICLNKDNKEFIKEFVSARDASEWLYNNFLCSSYDSGMSSIHLCCRGKQHTAYGYIWKYAE